LKGLRVGIRADTTSISAIIPAYNEEKTVGEIVSKTLCHVDEVIVIDDGSTDNTAAIARRAGANVIRNQINRGILVSLTRGFRASKGDILVTLDADGQHDPDEIPILVEPIMKDEADLVLGRRPELPYFSERVISKLTAFKVDVTDASTGFRAIRRSIASRMNLHGSCTCGTFVLEACALGAQVTEVPITVRERADEERRIRTSHLKQILYVLYDLLRY
jgi:glycosyltransferase involved in cell wall biosynthesis